MGTQLRLRLTVYTCATMRAYLCSRSRLSLQMVNRAKSELSIEYLKMCLLALSSLIYISGPPWKTVVLLNPIYPYPTPPHKQTNKHFSIIFSFSAPFLHFLQVKLISLCFIKCTFNNQSLPLCIFYLCIYIILQVEIFWAHESKLFAFVDFNCTTCFYNVSLPMHISLLFFSLATWCKNSLKRNLNYAKSFATL